MSDSSFQNSSALQRCGTIPCEGRVRLPNHCVGHSRTWRQILYLTEYLVIEIFGQVFRGWIDGREWLQVVNELMIQALDDFPDYLLEVRKIHQQADAVQLRTLQRDLHAVIVSVDVFTLSLI